VFEETEKEKGEEVQGPDPGVGLIGPRRHESGQCSG
jgi:hypothetical protein